MNAKRLKVAAIAAIIEDKITSDLLLVYSALYRLASCLRRTQQHLAILNITGRAFAASTVQRTLMNIFSDIFGYNFVRE